MSHIIKYSELVTNENLTDLYILKKFLNDILEEIDCLRPFIEEVKVTKQEHKWQNEIVYYNKLCWNYETGLNRLNKLKRKK